MSVNNPRVPEVRLWYQKHAVTARQWLPGIITLLMFIVALVFLHRGLRNVTLNEVLEQVQLIGPGNIFFAMVLTGCSYFLITFYDFLALRHVKFPMTWGRMAPTAFTAAAIGHNVGFAALSGGAIRYRGYALAGVDALRIAGVVLFCTVTYFVGGSFLLGIALLVEPDSLVRAVPVASATVRVVGVFLIVAALAYLLWAQAPRAIVKVGALTIAPPHLRVAACQLVLGATDVFLAALIMYLMLPEGFAIGYWSFLGIYLLCMAVAVLSNVPGGIGVFEGSMLLMLSEVSAPELVGTLLTFRLVYFLFPLLVGLVVFIAQLLVERHQRTRSLKQA